MPTSDPTSSPSLSSHVLRSPSLRPSLAQHMTSEKLMTMRDRRIRALIEAVAGVGGNFYAATIMQPMDVIKMRMQIPDSQYTSIPNAFKTIAAEEGISTLYTGLTSELIKGGAQNFIYLYFYQFMKDLTTHRDRVTRLRSRISSTSTSSQQTPTSSRNSSNTSLHTANSHTSLQSSSQTALHALQRATSLPTSSISTSTPTSILPSKPTPAAPLPMGINLLIGIIAGCITQIFVNPLSVVQTRIMTHKHTSGTISDGMLSMTRKILKEEGIWALYAGILPAFILTTNPAIQYLVFDRLKDSWIRFLYKRDTPRNPSSFELFMIGAIAKIVATLVTYPYIMAKVRLQWKGDNGAVKYAGTIDVLSQILKQDGFFGLYTGLQPQLFKSVCSASLLLMAKEKCARFLETMFLS